MPRSELATQVLAALQAAGYRDIREEHPVVFSYLSVDQTQQERTVVAAVRLIDVRLQMIESFSPKYLVVEDDPQNRRAQEDLIEQIHARGTVVLSESAFVDLLWPVARVVDWLSQSYDDGEGIDIPLEERGLPLPGPGEGYVRPPLSEFIPGQGPVARSLPVNAWVEGFGEDFTDELVVVTAQAGGGKSELTRDLCRRGLQRYQNALTRRERDSTVRIPPLVIRIPIRRLEQPTTRYIRDYIVNEADLPGLSSALLRFMVATGRIVLLLDGLDESTANAQVLEQAGIELAGVARDGGRILITTRLGSRKQEAPLWLRDLAPRFLMLDPLTDEESVRLLKLWGADDAEAVATAEALPGELRGIPLYLLWSWAQRISLQGHGTTFALRDLVERVCEREEGRNNLGLTPMEQMQILGRLAVELEPGTTTREDLRLLVGSHKSHFVDGPHALLAADGEMIHFRHDGFRSVALAQGLDDLLHEYERSGRFRQSLQNGWLSTHRLEPVAAEALAYTLDRDLLRKAWEAASLAPLRNQPHLRRNLLEVSLFALDTVGNLGDAHTLREHRSRRGELLAQLLGNRDLSGVWLDRLVLERIDFDGWDLRGIDAEGASFSYCDFRRAIVDDALLTATHEPPIDPEIPRA